MGKNLLGEAGKTKAQSRTLQDLFEGVSGSSVIRWVWFGQIPIVQPKLVHVSGFVNMPMSGWAILSCTIWNKGGLDPWVGKISWRRAWQPTAVSLPKESHGQRSLEGYSPWGHKESDTTEVTQHIRKQLPFSDCEQCLGRDEAWKSPSKSWSSRSLEPGSTNKMGATEVDCRKIFSLPRRWAASQGCWGGWWGRGGVASWVRQRPCEHALCVPCREG